MKKTTLSVLAYIVALIIFLQIPFTPTIGAPLNFTFYDFLAPLSGSFFGIVPGIIAVIVSQIISIFIHGFQAVALLRLIPITLGVFIFAKKSKLQLILPAIAILLFNLNPVSRPAWVYSLFWVIPMIAYFIKSKSILLKSLATTFTIHAVGGIVWLFAFNLPAEAWLKLIPIVIIERLIFTLGMSAFYTAHSYLKNHMQLSTKHTKNI